MSRVGEPRRHLWAGDRVVGDRPFQLLLGVSRPHFPVAPHDFGPPPILPPQYFLKSCAERRREVLRATLDDAGGGAAYGAGELIISIDPPEPLHREEVFAGLIDHDPTHPAE